MGPFDSGGVSSIYGPLFRIELVNIGVQIKGPY